MQRHIIFINILMMRSHDTFRYLNSNEFAGGEYLAASNQFGFNNDVL